MAKIEKRWKFILKKEYLCAKVHIQTDMKKGTKRFIVILGVIVALLAALQIATPPIARNYINSHGEELLGRRVQIGSLWINIFNASLKAGDIKIYERDGVGEFVSCGEFSTRMRIFPLISERLIISRISFSDAKVNVTQDGDKFNFDDLMERFADDSTAAPDPTPSNWEIGIYNIALRNSGLCYRDLQVGSDWDLQDITLEIPGFYFSSKQTDAGLQLDFPDGGSLKSDIAYDYLDGTYDLTLALRNFSIGGLLPYMRQYMNLSQVDGHMGCDVRVKGKTSSVFDFDVSGNAWLHGFDLIDEKGREVVAADSAAIDIADINLQQQLYLLRSMKVCGMRTHFEMYDQDTHSFTGLMREDVAEEPDSCAGQEPMRILVDRMDFVGGTIRVTDHTPREAFHFTIGDLSAHADAFSPSGYCSLTASATLNETGKATLHWSGNPSDASNHDITVAIHNVDMTHFSPYTLTMFGYPFSHGVMSFTGQNIIRNNQLKGTNHIDIYRPTLDKKRKDFKPEYSVPLKMGLYILTDRNGRMKIDLPVSGDMNSPQFSYGKIITGAIVNTLVKVVTSPAKYLAEAMGISADKLDQIDVDAAQVEFTSEQYDRIADLSRIIKERPELKLALTQRVNYSQALGNEALAQLKLAYFLRNNPSKKDMALSMLEYESALTVDLKSKQLAAFADSMIVASGKKPSGDLTARARMLYTPQAEAKLVERANLRNSTLCNHFSSKLGHADTCYKVAAVVLDSLKNYKGRSCYAVSFSMGGETAAAAAAPAE